MEDLKDLDLDLENEFGGLDVDVSEKEVEISDDDLQRFASSFPDWNLLPENVVDLESIIEKYLDKKRRGII